MSTTKPCPLEKSLDMFFSQRVFVNGESEARSTCHSHQNVSPNRQETSLRVGSLLHLKTWAPAAPLGSHIFSLRWSGCCSDSDDAAPKSVFNLTYWAETQESVIHYHSCFLAMVHLTSSEHSYYFPFQCCFSCSQQFGLASTSIWFTFHLCPKELEFESSTTVMNTLRTIL